MWTYYCGLHGKTCCKDEIQFNKLLNNDFKLESRWSPAQNCEIQLYPPNLSDCQYIGQLRWGDGTITNGKFPDTLDFIHEYLGPGKFKVCITIKEGIDSSCFLGTICSDIQINNDCKLTVDTDNPLGTNILIFPNPAHEKIQIQSQISFNRLEIYNLDGRKLMCLNE